MSDKPVSLDFVGGWRITTDIDGVVESTLAPDANLNFKKKWRETSNLNFGEAPDSKDTSVAISGKITLLASGSMTAEDAPTYISVSGVIDTFSASGSVSANFPEAGVYVTAFYDLNAVVTGLVSYDPNTTKLIGASFGSRSELSKVASRTASSGFENSQNAVNSINSDWQQSKLTANNIKGVFELSGKLGTQKTPLFEQSKLIGNDSQQLAENMDYIQQQASVKVEQSRLIGGDDWFGFETMARRQIEREFKQEFARYISRDYLLKSFAGRVVGNHWQFLMEAAKLPDWLYVPPDPIPPEIDPDFPNGYQTKTSLNFLCKWLKPDTTLNFGAECQQKQPPDYSKGFIFVTNSVDLKRTDDGRNITLLSFSVGIDSNSYAWSFSASVPISELSKVNTAIESRIGVDLTVNGHLWRFILDGCEDSAAFGERSLTIKGKSRAMLLAHPYANHRGYKYDTAMTARQIAEDELNRNAVPSGFTLDWDLVGVNGWNIPANTYSYTGRTPINSLQWIAEAAGGFINADMSEDILHVKALYPVKSWEWHLQATGLVLPQSLILNRTRSRVTKPNYNGVTIYGENDNGIGALIKRTGTSGGYQPPMITSDLITDNDVATARGIAVLSDVGEIGNIGITMPLHADFGVLKPSTLIGIDDGEQWVGMVRGTTITGRLSSNRALEIDQSIDVERHFDKEIV